MKEPGKNSTWHRSGHHKISYPDRFCPPSSITVTFPFSMRSKEVLFVRRSSKKTVYFVIFKAGWRGRRWIYLFVLFFFLFCFLISLSRLFALVLFISIFLFRYIFTSLCWFIFFPLFFLDSCFFSFFSFIFLSSQRNAEDIWQHEELSRNERTNKTN